MGVGWHLYLGAGLDARSPSICPCFARASQLRRNLDIDFAMPLSADHSVVFTAELHDLFRVDRHGDVAFSRGISKRPQVTDSSFRLRRKSKRRCRVRTTAGPAAMVILQPEWMKHAQHMISVISKLEQAGPTIYLVQAALRCRVQFRLVTLSFATR
jgi:hypothetical protein